jgi:hypothetical protein
MREGALPTALSLDDIAHKKVEFIADGVIERRLPGLMDRLKGHIAQAMSARRHPPLDSNDWERRIRELEGQIDDIARDHEPGISVHNVPRHHKPEKRPEISWLRRIAEAAAAIVLAAGVLAAFNAFITVRDLDTRMTLYKEEIDKHLESTDKREDSLDSRVLDNERRLNQAGPR